MSIVCSGYVEVDVVLLLIILCNVIKVHAVLLLRFVTLKKTRRAISVETQNCVKSEERAKMAVRMTLHKQSRPAKHNICP